MSFSSAEQSIAQFVRQPQTDFSTSLDEQIQPALKAIRTHLGMDVAFVSEFSEGRRYFRHVDASSANQPVEVGGSDPLEDSYCQRVIDGRLPELMRDAAAYEEARSLPVTAALPVGAHLSVPVKLKGGHLYGTFCCFSFKPDQSLTERDLSTMRAFADLTAVMIDHHLGERERKMEAENRIQSVLSGDFLSVVYQPIYSLSANALVGFESLSRFSALPVRSPDCWFHEANEIGLGVALERKVIKAALLGAESLLPHGYVSVNVSPTTMLNGDVSRVLEDFSLERIVLEITEHDAIEDYRVVAAAVEPLRRRGLRIAVDDAGAGYASFRHILSLAPDIIKLDVSLTRNIDSDASRQSLASAFISFAAATKSTIVAEGVETAAELAVLRRLGVPQAQGYFLSKPIPADEAANRPYRTQLSPARTHDVFEGSESIGGSVR